MQYHPMNAANLPFQQTPCDQEQASTYSFWAHHAPAHAALAAPQQAPERQHQFPRDQLEPTRQHRTLLAHTSCPRPLHALVLPRALQTATSYHANRSCLCPTGLGSHQRAFALTQQYVAASLLPRASPTRPPQLVSLLTSRPGCFPMRTVLVSSSYNGHLEPRDQPFPWLSTERTTPASRVSLAWLISP